MSRCEQPRLSLIPLRSSFSFKFFQILGVSFLPGGKDTPLNCNVQGLNLVWWLS